MGNKIEKVHPPVSLFLSLSFTVALVEAAGRAAFRAHFANVRSLNMREAERARIEVPLEILAGYEFMTVSSVRVREGIE